MLLLDWGVGIDMFAELGDAPRAMRIAGDQAVDQLLDAARTTAHVNHPLPLSKYQKHLNGPRGFLVYMPPPLRRRSV
jgi:hypothetical protein